MHLQTQMNHYPNKCFKLGSEKKKKIKKAARLKKKNPVTDLNNPT